MHHDNWRLSYLFREATLNLFSAGSRLRPLIVMAVILGTTNSVFATIETISLDVKLELLTEAGRNVVAYRSVDPDQPAAISRASCERLSLQDGVTRAGLLVPAQRRSIYPLGEQIAVYGASRTLVPDLAEVGAVVGSELANPGQIKRLMVISSGSVMQATVGEAEPEGVPLNSAVTVPLTLDQSSGPVCIVVLDRLADVDVRIPQLQAQLNVVGAPILGSKALEETSNPLADYANRPGRYMPILLGLVGAASLAVTLRFRSSELAVYRLSGSSPRSLMLIITAEALYIGGIAAVAGSLTGLVLLPASGSGLSILSSAGMAALIVLGGSFAGAPVANQRPTELVKDR